jgi:uncharacterized protein
MRTKTILLSLMLALALLASACAPAVQPAAEAPRTLSVTGSARVTAQPDIASISIGVHTESDRAADAVTENNRQAQAIVTALTALGVSEADIQTLGFNIFPQDEWGPGGERTGTRFIVDNTVTVKVRDLDLISELLGAVIEAGANNIYGIQFDLEDKSELIAEARKKAVEDAQSQAQELASAAGITLGAIQSLNYYSSIPVPIFDNKVAFGMGGAEASSVPVSPGQLIITADVSITFEIR